MLTIDLGVVSIISKGLHDSSLNYERLNEVKDNNGNWYQALKNVPTGINLNNKAYWTLVRDNSANGTDTSVRVVNPPILTVIDTTVSSTYSVVDGYTGLQTASNWYVFQVDSNTLVSESLNDTQNLTSFTPIEGVSPNTNYVVKKEDISGDFKSELSNGVAVLTPNNYISMPTDMTVEGSPDSVPDLATVTLNSLPTTTNSTIDTVDFRVIKTSDGTEVGITQSTTTLTLPISFTSPALAVSTEYSFEIQCRDVNGSIYSSWGAITATTLASFSVTPTEGGYASGDRSATIAITEDWVWHSDYSDVTKLIDGATDSDPCVPGYQTDIGGKRITFDFGEAVKVASIKSYGNDNTVGIVKLQASDDGTTWTTIKDDFLLEYSANGTEYSMDILVDQRYFSILGVSDKPANSHWYEIEFGA